MEKVMVVVFDSETNALQGIRALKKLDAEGSITINEGALIRKNVDGSIAAPQKAMDDFPIRTLGGTAIGGLLGLLAGPAGYVTGAGVGALVGLAGDEAVGTVDDEFLNDASEKLKAGSSAVVLDVNEEWVTPVDTVLEPFSTAIFRRAKVDVQDELISKRIEADQKEFESLEEEHSRVREDRKAKIKAKIDELKARVRGQIERFDERKEQIRGENQAKIRSLQEKLSSGASENKARFQSHLAAIQKADLDFTERVDKKIGSRLRKVADRLERKTG